MRSTCHFWFPKWVEIGIDFGVVRPSLPWSLPKLLGFSSLWFSLVSLHSRLSASLPLCFFCLCLCLFVSLCWICLLSVLCSLSFPARFISISLLVLSYIWPLFFLAPPTSLIQSRPLACYSSVCLLLSLHRHRPPSARLSGSLWHLWYLYLSLLSVHTASDQMSCVKALS